jgi:hypothetical protein
MTPEARLARLLAADAPPARDYLFAAAVAERIARRRAWATVAALAPWAVAATAALWGLQPVVGPMADSLGEALTPAATALALAALSAVSALWLSRRARISGV